MLRIILSSAALLGALADNCAANGSCPSKQAGGVELLQRKKQVKLQRLNEPPLGEIPWAEIPPVSAELGIGPTHWADQAYQIGGDGQANYDRVMAKPEAERQEEYDKIVAEQETLDNVSSSAVSAELGIGPTHWADQAYQIGRDGQANYDRVMAKPEAERQEEYDKIVAEQEVGKHGKGKRGKGKHGKGNEAKGRHGNRKGNGTQAGEEEVAALTTGPSCDLQCEGNARYADTCSCGSSYLSPKQNPDCGAGELLLGTNNADFVKECAEAGQRLGLTNSRYPEVENYCHGDGDDCLCWYLDDRLQMNTWDGGWDGGSQGRFICEDPEALKCGFDVDCPLDYSLALVNKTSASSQASMETNRRVLEKVHDVARQACATAGNTNAAILPHGGWCYGTKTAKHPPPMQKNDMDYLVPAHHVSVDEVIANTLAERVLLKKDGSCCYSLTDLGAGVGQLGHALRARLPKLDYYGYDGAGNVEEFTSNYVRFADLTIPLSLKQTDWVVSTEVGEHIPHEYEAQVIANIHAHNCKGIILTWAVLKQSGTGHVNCHSNQYLIKAFEELGYKFNEDLAAALRVHRQMNRWFEHSSMVFERITKPAACAE